MIEPLLNQLKEHASEIRPQNDIALFCYENMNLLVPVEADDDNSLISSLREIIIKSYVNEANKNPESTEHNCLKFYEAFRQYYHRKYVEPVIND